MRSQTLIAAVVVALVAAGALVVGAAAAQAGVLGAPPQDLNTVIDNLRNVIVGLLAGLATLFLTIGGVLYLFAAGDPEQVSKAKNALKSAAIGYGIAVLAPLLVTLLKKVVGA